MLLDTTLLFDLLVNLSGFLGINELLRTLLEHLRHHTHMASRLLSLLLALASSIFLRRRSVKLLPEVWAFSLLGFVVHAVFQPVVAHDLDVDFFFIDEFESFGHVRIFALPGLLACYHVSRALGDAG